MEIRLSAVSGSGGALLLSLGLFCLPACPLAATLFINEIHYDNTGADSGEGIEIAGPAGTLLDGWRIRFYDGRRQVSYATLSLNGVLPDMGAGVGVLALSMAGIQNGSPDGVALLDPAGEVRQFLSYEGYFSVTEGNSEVLSRDIGVAESGDTPLGWSLQLTGQGRDYQDFTWSAGPATFGSFNQGQTFLSQPSPVPLPGAGLLMLSGMLLWGGFIVSAHRGREAAPTGPAQPVGAPSRAR